MKKILLWGNGSSENHGCEAMGITFSEIFKENEIYLCTLNSAKDDYLKTKKNIKLIDYSLRRKPSIPNRIVSKIERVCLHTNNFMNQIQSQKIEKVLDDVFVACSVGGDNYCYSDLYWIYQMQELISKKNIKSVLLGCSIEPSAINEKMRDSLSKYDLIIARESISYKFLKKINKNTYLVPDAAFILNPLKVELPSGFDNVIGINISPLILELNENSKMIYQNYKELISYILKETDYKIALIPHVVFDGKGGDILPIKKLYEEFNCDSRIFAIEEHNCSELKYIISKCRFLITARTHASIAGYSSMVPTLVVGYSNKAVGIATDLFGTDKNYVINSKDLIKENQLTKGFKWLEKNENEIRTHLETFIPNYSKQVYSMADILKKGVNND